MGNGPFAYCIESMIESSAETLRLYVVARLILFRLLLVFDVIFTIHPLPGTMVLCSSSSKPKSPMPDGGGNDDDGGKVPAPTARSSVDQNIMHLRGIDGRGEDVEDVNNYSKKSKKNLDIDGDIDGDMHITIDGSDHVGRINDGSNDIELHVDDDGTNNVQTTPDFQPLSRLTERAHKLAASLGLVLGESDVSSFGSDDAEKDIFPSQIRALAAKPHLRGLAVNASHDLNVLEQVTLAKDTIHEGWDLLEELVSYMGDDTFPLSEPPLLIRDSAVMLRNAAVELDAILTRLERFDRYPSTSTSSNSKGNGKKGGIFNHGHEKPGKKHDNYGHTKPGKPPKYKHAWTWQEFEDWGGKASHIKRNPKKILHDLQRKMHRFRKLPTFSLPRKRRRLQNDDNAPDKSHCYAEDCSGSTTEDNFACQCNKLVQCVREFSFGDFLHFFAKDWVSDDGEIDFEVDDPDTSPIFDAGGGSMLEKYDRIQDFTSILLVNAEDDVTCRKLLREFHSSCDDTESGCSGSASDTEFSLPSTVEEVCSSVGGPNHIQISEVARVFDEFPLDECKWGPFDLDTDRFGDNEYISSMIKEGLYLGDDMSSYVDWKHCYNTKSSVGGTSCPAYHGLPGNIGAAYGPKHCRKDWVTTTTGQGWNDRNDALKCTADAMEFRRNGGDWRNFIYNRKGEYTVWSYGDQRANFDVYIDGCLKNWKNCAPGGWSDNPDEQNRLRWWHVDLRMNVRYAFEDLMEQWEICMHRDCEAHLRKSSKKVCGDLVDSVNIMWKAIYEDGIDTNFAHGYSYYKHPMSCGTDETTVDPIPTDHPSRLDFSDPDNAPWNNLDFPKAAGPILDIHGMVDFPNILDESQVACNSSQSEDGVRKDGVFVYHLENEFFNPTVSHTFQYEDSNGITVGLYVHENYESDLNQNGDNKWEYLDNTETSEWEDTIPFTTSIYEPGQDCEGTLSFTGTKNGTEDFRCDDLSLTLFGGAPAGQIRSVARYVDDNHKMPGLCCLDTSVTGKRFGYKYDCNSDCLHYGPWWSGYSEEACSTIRGTFCPSPCTLLQSCIDNARLGLRDGQNCSSRTFNEYSSEMVIEDAEDQLECQNARELLGYDKDYPDDSEICDFVVRLSKDEFFYYVDETAGEKIDPIFGEFSWEDVEFESDSVDQPFKDVHNWDLDPVEDVGFKSDDWYNTYIDRRRVEQVESFFDIMTHLIADLECAAVCVIPPMGLGLWDHLYELCQYFCNWWRNIYLVISTVVEMAMEITLINLSRIEEQYDPTPYQMTEAINIMHATDSNLRSTKEGLFRNIEILNDNVNAQDAWLRGRFQKEHEIIVNLLQDQHEQIGNRLQLHHWILFKFMGINDTVINEYLQNAPYRRRLQATNQSDAADLYRNFSEHESNLNVTNVDLASSIDIPTPVETFFGNQHIIIQKLDDISFDSAANVTANASQVQAHIDFMTVEVNSTIHKEHIQTRDMIANAQEAALAATAGQINSTIHEEQSHTRDMIANAQEAALDATAGQINSTIHEEHSHTRDMIANAQEAALVATTDQINSTVHEEHSHTRDMIANAQETTRELIADAKNATTDQISKDVANAINSSESFLAIMIKENNDDIAIINDDIAIIKASIEAILNVDDRGLVANINCGPPPRGAKNNEDIEIHLLVDTELFGNSIDATVTAVKAVHSTKGGGVGSEPGTVESIVVYTGLQFLTVRLERNNDGIRNENDISILYLMVEHNAFTTRADFDYRTCRPCA